MANKEPTTQPNKQQPNAESETLNQDERLRGGESDQGKQEVKEEEIRFREQNASSRQERAVEDVDRASQDGTVLTKEERLALLRSEWQQEALPKAPEISGYHVCWLTTNSTYDPIHKRLRIGYELVKHHEVRGFEQYKMKSGEFDGCVTCNEMVLAKIPMEIYQMIMEEYHHNQPLQEEERIKAALKGKTSDDRTKATLEEGYEEFGKKVMPVFN